MEQIYETVLINPLLSVGVFVLLFFIVRSFLTWYWKLTDIKRLLERIEMNTRPRGDMQDGPIQEVEERVEEVKIDSIEKSQVEDPAAAEERRRLRTQNIKKFLSKSKKPLVVGLLLVIIAICVRFLYLQTLSY